MRQRVNDYTVTYPYATYIKILPINKKSQASKEKQVRVKKEECTKGNASGRRALQAIVSMVIRETQLKAIRYYFSVLRLAKITLIYQVFSSSKLILLKKNTQ